MDDSAYPHHHPNVHEAQSHSPFVHDVPSPRLGHETK